MKQHIYFACNWFQKNETKKSFINRFTIAVPVVRFKVLISMAVLIASLFLLINRLFTPQVLQITLESGQEITTSTPEYFSFEAALILVVCAFLIGFTAVYLFYNSDGIRTMATPSLPASPNADMYNTIMPLLKADEKKAIAALRESNGEMQQNKLALKLGVSKVKATRILQGLQQKNLIRKERHGLTNMIKLEK